MLESFKKEKILEKSFKTWFNFENLFLRGRYYSILKQKIIILFTNSEHIGITFIASPPEVIKLKFSHIFTVFNFLTNFFNESSFLIAK